MAEKKIQLCACVFIFATTVIFCLSAVCIFAQTVPKDPLYNLPANVKSKLSSNLTEVFSHMEKTEPVRVLIRIKKKKSGESDLPNLKPRRRQAFKKLKRQALESQTDIIRLINRKRMQRRERVLPGKFREFRRAEKASHDVKNYWISNTIAVDLSAEELEEIASHPDVLGIEENTVVSIPPVEAAGEDDGPLLNLWNLAAIGLDQISGLGLDGEGVRIGFIDTGIYASHPDLAGKLVGWAEFGYTGEKIDSDPHETHYLGHGTHVASVLAGDSTGIAPGATLIGALALPSGSGSTEQVLAAMEWILDPDQDPETEDGAQIVNMSWGSYGASNVLREAVDNMTKAGVLPAGAIGNLGPWYSLSPGNAPGAIGVGAVDQDDYVTGFSGGGEVCWDDICLVKPDISAPGVSIPGVGAMGQYQVLRGTSFAAPHVAGAAALLLQVNPDLNLSQLRGFLLNTGVDLGDDGPDARYGRGRLDLSAAFDFTERYMTRFGTSDLVLETLETDENDTLIRVYHSFFSDGETSFTDHSALYEVDAANTAPIGLADVDADGFADLVVRRTDLIGTEDYLIQYLVYRSADAGGFSDVAETWYAFSAESADPYEIIGLADVNGDRKGDLVYGQRIETVPNYYQTNIHVLISNGLNQFERQDHEWASFSHNSIYQVNFSIGDINGDGKADLVTGKRYIYFTTPQSYYVAPSSGNGFQTSQFPAGSISSAFYGPLQLTAVKDVNGDGLDDLIFSPQILDFTSIIPVSVCLSTATTMLQREKKWASIPLQAGGGIQAVADVNGDGAADIIVRTSGADPEFDVWLSNGSGQFIESDPTWLDWTETPSGTGIRVVGSENIGLGDWH